MESLACQNTDITTLSVRGGGGLISLRKPLGIIKSLTLPCKTVCYTHKLTRHFSDIKNTKPAFTLAEVLITIGIIGIVASMMLVIVMTNVERARNAAILRRAYADLTIYVNKFAQEKECSTYLTDCAPNWGQFVWEFAKFLHDEQKFVEVDSRCRGKENCYTWLKVKPNGKDNPRNFSSVYSISSPNTSSYLLESPTGLYAFVIDVHMNDNYYHINGDYFRARIHIITDIGRLKPALNNELIAENYKDLTVPQLGRNMFEVYVMNSKRVLPNGTSLCSGRRVTDWSYYCHALDTSPSGNCSYESGDYSACFQKVIDDGWKIKYRY